MVRDGKLTSDPTLLLDALKGEEYESFDRSIDVHVSRLRAKLEPDPKRPRYIKTVRGVGYVLTRE